MIIHKKETEKIELVSRPAFHDEMPQLLRQRSALVAMCRTVARSWIHLKMCPGKTSRETSYFSLCSWTSWSFCVSDHLPRHLEATQVCHLYTQLILSFS